MTFWLKVFSFAASTTAWAVGKRFSHYTSIRWDNHRYFCYIVSPGADAWSSLVVGDEGCIGPSGKLLCLLYQTPKNYAHTMQYLHGIIPYIFDCLSPPTIELHGWWHKQILALPNHSTHGQSTLIGSNYSPDFSHPIRLLNVSKAYLPIVHYNLFLTSAPWIWVSIKSFCQNWWHHNLMQIFILPNIWYLNIKQLGSGCGSVVRAVASYTRGTPFGSSHRQKNYFYIEQLFTVNCVLKRRK